ncbi:MAG: energy-coupling factor ABC transporter ATP-binding protein [Anaerolineae bacterium]
MQDDIIVMEHVTYQYLGTDQPALKDVNLRIRRGEYVALLGRTGAGKTTLCLSLNGIVPHMTMGEFSGRVLIDGIDTQTKPVREMAKKVGMVFDNPEYQLSQMTVREEVALGLENLGVPREEMLRRIAEVLEIVELSGLDDRSPLALSGGQQQRLAIAAALAMYPEILVLDEPTSNLDPLGKREVFRVARQLNKERGMSIIIAEHEVEVMALHADRIIALDQGEIVLNGTPHEVFREVETLDRIGVRVPQVTQLAYELDHQYGKWGEAYPVTLQEALQALRDRIGGC